MQETDTPVPVGRSSAARTDPRGRSYGVELELSLVGGRIVATSVTLTAPEGVDTTLLRAFPLKEVVDEAIAAQAKLWARHLERPELDKRDRDLVEDVKKATEK